MSVEELPRSLAALARSLREKRLSPVEIVRALLERIEAADEEINAFLTVTGERALEQAGTAEREILAGEYRGPLHGVPVALKDLIFTKGIRTTMGSAFFANYVPGYDATVVRRLEDAGAVIIGKTNTHEFAYGPTGDRSHFGPTRNPHDPARIPGGSSGGSGAAVAANLVYGALGSDTGGSVRIPAALCGVVGMKPTFGRVSKRGVFPLSENLDHVGPLTRTVEDNALLLNVLAGHDPEDPSSTDRIEEDFTRDLHRGVRGGVIGVPTSFYFDHIEDEVEAKVREAIEVFEDLGTKVREVEVQGLQEILEAQRTILAVEAHAIHEERLRTEPEKFGEEVRERLLEGGRIEEERYTLARRMKRRSREEFERALELADALLAPTVPIAATEIGQREIEVGGREEPVRSALTRLTGPTNLNGLPSLSVPCGFTARGLSVGMQLIGRPFGEAALYRFGHAYEQSL